MIELKSDELIFSFPKVHPEAVLRIRFLRTLRIPDDSETYFLPPGLGRFPLRHVDDFRDRVPPSWIEYGGVMLPMYQSEALWLKFDGDYPFLIKVGTGKINAVSGKLWTNRINRVSQNYLVAPDQPWLDGYCVGKGAIRQFVAMPLGRGYTAEEQITGKAERGGMQLLALPMKGSAYDAYQRNRFESEYYVDTVTDCQLESVGLGIAPGGRMKQEIYADPYQFEDWDLKHKSRCFVHIVNSNSWKTITGEYQPTIPLCAATYNQHNLPWFDYYNEDFDALDGAKALQHLKSIATMCSEKDHDILPENASFNMRHVIKIKGSRRRVREGEF